MSLLRTLALLTLLALPAAAGPALWQLALAFDGRAVRVAEVTAIPEARSRLPTGGPGTRLDYELTWLGANNRVLARTRVALPLSLRPAGTRHGLPFVPAHGVTVVRAEGPASLAEVRAIRLERAAGKRAPVADLPAPWRRDVLTLEVPARATKRRRELPAEVTVAKVRDNGDDANRLVLVIAGDGYTRADLASGAYARQVEGILADLFAREPWSRYKSLVNVYRLDVPSRQSGVTEPDANPPIARDTYFESSFNMYGIPRLLALSDAGTLRAVQIAGQAGELGLWDNVMVICNSTRYGGSGGTVTVTSIEQSVLDLVQHELGHTFGALADEYEYPGPLPVSDSYPNVDLHPVHGPELKWYRWVDAATPLPTPVSPENSHLIGAFEGANYHPTGSYRPVQNCMMRMLGVPFCAVCQEAHAMAMFRRVSLVDRTLPAAGTTQAVGPGGLTISVTTAPVAPIAYTWSLAGRRLPARGPSITVKPEDLPGPTSDLEVTVRHPSTKIRLPPPTVTLKWTLTVPSR